jgi:photosynthetic reaction center cytochrome c subunit
MSVVDRWTATLSQMSGDSHYILVLVRLSALMPSYRHAKLVPPFARGMGNLHHQEQENNQMRGSRVIFFGCLQMILFCLQGIVFSSSQPGVQTGRQTGTQIPRAQAPLLAENVHSDIRLLRGIPEDEFIDTMGFFSASTGLNCIDCHVLDSQGNWGKFADETDRMRTARRMLLMVRAINQSYFGGARMVTCYTCHRGSERPEVTPSLAVQYAIPGDEDPEVITQQQALAEPSADSILNKYIQALGGQERVAALTSFAAKGTYEGYDTDTTKVPVEIYAKSPGQRTMIVHTAAGDNTTVCDGRAAWIAATDKPLSLLTLTGGDLDGAKVDAALSFPALIKQSFTAWRTGPAIVIDDQEVQIVQGTSPGRSPVKLYFDTKSGLLVRQERYTNTPVGEIPAQVDYSDYREVSGVQVPFHILFTWTDGQSTVDLSEVQTNIAIDPAKFEKPAPREASTAVRTRK